MHDTKTQLCRVRNGYYEHENKSGKLLAHSLRETSRRSYIPHIDTSKGKHCNMSHEIAEVFREYHSSFYNLSVPLSTDQCVEKQQLIREYLSSSGLPLISEEAHKSMNAPISTEKYLVAIKLLKPQRLLAQTATAAFALIFAPRFM